MQNSDTSVKNMFRINVYRFTVFHDRVLEPVLVHPGAVPAPGAVDGGGAGTVADVPVYTLVQ